MTHPAQAQEQKLLGEILEMTIATQEEQRKMQTQIQMLQMQVKLQEKNNEILELRIQHAEHKLQAENPHRQQQRIPSTPKRESSVSAFGHNPETFK